MRKTFSVPVVTCDACGGELTAAISTRAPVIQVKCGSCGAPVEFEDAGAQVYGRVQQQGRRTGKIVARSLVELRRTVPKNQDELWRAVRDPRHPFTAALLVGIALVLMEMTGFGIFLAVSWILGNLILNPLGWFLIPVVVAIALAYRRVFARESFQRIRDQLTELQEKHSSGEISDEELARAREQTLAQAFDVAALEGALRRGDFDSKWIERIRETSRNVKPEWIWDDEHLAALRKAIVGSKSQLFIYSGWLNIDVIKVIVEELSAAIGRGVAIYIGYGWESPSGRQAQSERELRALDRLREITPDSDSRGGLVVKRFPNHSKLLVCDDDYVICGSANWLSNSGYHNREVSVRFHDSLLVKQFLEEAASDFAQPPESVV